MAFTRTHSAGALLRDLILILAVIAASVGGTLLYSSRPIPEAKADEASGQAKPSIPAPIYVALDPFTVTLQDDFNRRILYTAITLRVADQASARLLSDYMPEVRNRTLLTLSAQKPGAVQTPDGRTALARSLTTVLEAPYSPDPAGPKISKVLFTAFVVQ